MTITAAAAAAAIFIFGFDFVRCRRFFGVRLPSLIPYRSADLSATTRERLILFYKIAVSQRAIIMSVIATTKLFR